MPEPLFGRGRVICSSGMSDLHFDGVAISGWGSSENATRWCGAQKRTLCIAMRNFSEVILREDGSQKLEPGAMQTDFLPK